MKIAFLSNYTNNFLVKEIEKRLKQAKIKSEIYLPGFNQINQEIIAPNSGLHDFNPDIIFISIDYVAIFENSLNNLIKPNNIDVKKNILEEFENFLNVLLTLKNNISAARIFVDNVIIDSRYFNHLLENNSDFSVSDMVLKLNKRLNHFVRDNENFVVINLLQLLQQYGEKTLFDYRLNYISKNKWSNIGLQKVAELYFRYINAYLGKRKKCIVLDLDNTLWGGIVGQDGLEKIILNNDGEGKAYYDFQMNLLKLYNQGILLAINSKNNEEDALEAIEKHPYMVLRKRHFAAMRINWVNKAQNIKEIAEELNIGIDSLIFLDDSEFERNLIRTELPEVVTPDLPSDPSEYSNFLASLPYFDSYKLSVDDFKRNETYIANAQRNSLRKSFTNIEEYYYSLNMKVFIKEINDLSFNRVVQLVHKTNQFNMTTKRYSESELLMFRNRDDVQIYTVRLEDKFGDYGIIGVIILFIEEENIRIDSFIMSCRAIGRTVENAVLSYIFDLAKKLNKKKIIGEFVPTKKNAPASKVYYESGFQKRTEHLWEFNVNENIISCPKWLILKEEK